MDTVAGKKKRSSSSSLTYECQRLGVPELRPWGVPKYQVPAFADIFEGSEKRLELDFKIGIQSPSAGLRCLSRTQLDRVLDKAACCIVSHKHWQTFDAYVLSESSLFVYATKIVLKTCGTTRLLDTLPEILSLASSLYMQPQRCKFSRASYLFPELQPELYRSFTSETEVLESFFGDLGTSGSYVLGDDAHGLQWHIYVASIQGRQDAELAPTYSLEICMTELCKAKAAQFSRTNDFVSAKHTTCASGIGSMLGGAEIDDFVFDPCGYSMNGCEGEGFSTIHVTPEHGFSYASLELSGYPAKAVDPTAIVTKAMEVFRPGRVTVSLSVNKDLPFCKWTQGLSCPPGFLLQGTSAQHFSCGGCLYHYCFQEQHTAKEHGLETPTAVLDTMFSNPSFAGDDSDQSAGEYSRSSSPSVFGPTEEWESVRCLQKPDLTVDLLKVIKQSSATIITSGRPQTVEAYMADLVASQQLEDPLYIVDLGLVTRLYRAWQEALPRVTPFYAVKALTDRAVISTLAALGAGFDCASQSEMETVLSLGVPADRIILANCCKRPKDLRTAASQGVALSTFDTVCELQKMARMHPGAAGVLRIRADDPGARCPLGNKYGAEPEHIDGLLQAAKALGVKVVGVSFHVGSAATNPAAFEEAIAMADHCFALGLEQGFDMKLLDIGGGFSSDCFNMEGETSIPAAVNRALDRHFPASRGVQIISEPGRYFAEEAATLACMVMGVRNNDLVGKAVSRDYWIADGLYGSMNSLLYDHAEITAHTLGTGGKSQAGKAATYPSTVFGPSCDGLDVVLKDYPLPELGFGDWLVFPRMGAYTLAGACDFNGMGVSPANVRYVFSATA